MSTCMWLSISSSLSIIADWPWKHRLYLWEWSYKKLSSSETYGRWREQKTKGRRRGRAKQSHEGMIKLFLSVGFHIVNYNYIIYSGIPSCGHSIEMAALLLWPHYSGPNKSSVSLFFKGTLYYGHLVNKARLLLPIGDQINGFHCTWSDLQNLPKVGSSSSDSMPELLFTVKNHLWCHSFSCSCCFNMYFV